MIRNSNLDRCVIGLSAMNFNETKYTYGSRCEVKMIVHDGGYTREYNVTMCNYIVYAPVTVVCRRSAAVAQNFLKCTTTIRGRFNYQAISNITN